MANNRGGGWLYRGLKVAKHVDPRKTVSGFWTKSDAIKEAKARQRELRKGVPEERRLRKKLGKCGPKRRCLSPACAKCHGQFQVLFAAQTGEILSWLENLVGVQRR